MSLNRKKIRQVIICGDLVGSAEQFYSTLEDQLRLPEHFGRNLDALWDVLTTDIEGPLEIVWENAAASRASMGDVAKTMMELLLEVAKERQDFKVYLK